MATADREQSVQNRIAQYLLFGVIQDAMDLVRRFQEGQGFRGYVRERTALLVPIGLLVLLTSIGCAAATVLYLGGTRSLLVLLALLLVPFVLVGSLFVQAYVFASWLEGRALAKALHRRPPPGAIAARLRKAGIDMGSMPSVPWALAALFLVLPLAMLASVVPMLAWTLIALHILAPVVFARLDR
jgi:hypothetical protein